MNLRGRQVRGGVLSGEICVSLRAVGHLPDADLVVAGRKVFLLEEIFELPVGGDHAAGDGMLAALTQGFGVLRRKAGGRLEGAVKRAVFRLLHDLLGDLRRDAGHDDLGLEDVFLHALAHQGDVLLDERGQFFEPRAPVLVVFLFGETQVGQEVVGVLHAALLADRTQKEAETVAVDVGLQIALEKVVIELVGRGKRRAVNGTEGFERVEVVLVAGVDGGEASVFPAVVEPVIAQAGSPRRIVLHRVIPLGSEEVGEGLGSIGSRGAWGHEAKGGRSGEKGQQAVSGHGQKG